MRWSVVYIKYQMLKIKAQCWRDHYVGDQHYFGADALHVKNYSSVLKGSLCRWSTLFWSWGITCENFELNADMISMPAVNIILELKYYVWKLELNVHSITMSVINTILELRHYITWNLKLGVNGITMPVIKTILELRQCGFPWTT